MKKNHIWKRKVKDQLKNDKCPYCTHRLPSLIVDMIKMLKKMGANISGEGTNVIEINGVKRIKICEIQSYAR